MPQPSQAVMGNVLPSVTKMNEESISVPSLAIEVVTLIPSSFLSW